MSEIDPSELLTVPEVARLLRVSRMTIKRMVTDGRLVPAEPRNPALRRQHYRFKASDVAALAQPHLDAAPARLLAEEPPPGYDPHG